LVKASVHSSFPILNINFSIHVFWFLFSLFFIVISHSGLCTKRNHHSPGNLTFFYHFIVHFFAMSFLVFASPLNNFLDSLVGILIHLWVYCCAIFLGWQWWQDIFWIVLIVNTCLLLLMSSIVCLHALSTCRKTKVMKSLSLLIK